MRKVRAFIVAFALGLAAVCLVSAPISAADADVPIKGTSVGTVRFDTATGAITVDKSGVSSQLGKYTVHLEGTGTFSDAGTFSGSGTATFVAANGDTLTGTYTATGNDSQTTSLITFTGGTGRFANATGKMTMICDRGPGRPEGTVLVFNVNCTHDGTISKVKV